MIENIAIKRIGFLNKKQREYTEYKLVQQAQNGAGEVGAPQGEPVFKKGGKMKRKGGCKK